MTATLTSPPGFQFLILGDASVGSRVSTAAESSVLGDPDTPAREQASHQNREPRLRGPRGEELTDAETAPIRVHKKAGRWQVDYGSYAQGFHDTRSAAIETAIAAANYENRELIIDRPREIAPDPLDTDGPAYEAPISSVPRAWQL